MTPEGDWRVPGPAREAYRAANRQELRPATPWKVAVVRVIAVVCVLAMVANVVVLVVRLVG